MSHFTSQFRLQLAYVLASGSSLFAGRFIVAQKPRVPPADEREMRQGVLPPMMTADKEIPRRTKSHRWSGVHRVQVRLILTENKEELDALFGDSWPGRHKDEGIR
jgi:hypothetical protein